MRTEREKFLIQILPAVLVVLVYALFFHRPQQRHLATIQKQLAEAKPATAESVEGIKSQLTAARQANNDLKSRAEELRGTIERIHDGLQSPDRRFEAIDRMNQLVTRHDITLISQKTLDRPVLPKKIESALQQIERQAGLQKMEYVELSLRGNFARIDRLVADLLRELTTAFPVSLDLDATDPTSPPTWNLVLAL